MTFFQSLGVRLEHCVWICQESSGPSFYWQIFVFFYLVLLQVIGLVLAIQTRKVKLQGLRDSKYIAAIIYISSISIVVMALVTFALEHYINIGTGIFVFCVFTLTTIFLILVFIPKVLKKLCGTSLFHILHTLCPRAVYRCVTIMISRLFYIMIHNSCC